MLCLKFIFGLKKAVWFDKIHIMTFTFINYNNLKQRETQMKLVEKFLYQIDLNHNIYSSKYIRLNSSSSERFIHVHVEEMQKTQLIQNATVTLIIAV